MVIRASREGIDPPLSCMTSSTQTGWWLRYPPTLCDTSWFWEVNFPSNFFFSRPLLGALCACGRFTGARVAARGKGARPPFACRLGLYSAREGHGAPVCAPRVLCVRYCRCKRSPGQGLPGGSGGLGGGGKWVLGPLLLGTLVSSAKMGPWAVVRILCPLGRPLLRGVPVDSCAGCLWRPHV